MANDLISVIIPVYKVEKYIYRCVDSVINQTYENLEIILVDDGSPDNCPEICDEYQKKDSRIKVIHQKNQGLSAARNTGIRNATGKYLSFVDSDDWIHLKFIECLYDAISANNVHMGICSFKQVCCYSPDEVITPQFEVYTPEEFWKLNQLNSTISCGKIYNLDLFENIYFPVGKIHEDEFTTYKVLFQCEKLAVSDAQMYYYYKNDESITHLFWTSKKYDQIEALREQIAFFKTEKFNIAKKTSKALLVCNVAYQMITVFNEREHIESWIKHINKLFLIFIREISCCSPHTLFLAVKKVMGYLRNKKTSNITCL